MSGPILKAQANPPNSSMALRLHNRRWYPLIFLIGFATVIAAWLRFAAGHRPELLASAIGGIAGFTYFLYRQHLDETKLFKELFKEFNARYDALNDDLNTILSGPSEGSLSPDEEKPVFSYFNLCAEEYFFYKAGYIDRRVGILVSRHGGLLQVSTHSGTLETGLRGRFVLWLSSTPVNSRRLSLRCS